MLAGHSMSSAGGGRKGLCNSSTSQSTSLVGDAGMLDKPPKYAFPREPFCADCATRTACSLRRRSPLKLEGPALSLRAGKGCGQKTEGLRTALTLLTHAPKDDAWRQLKQPQRLLIGRCCRARSQPDPAALTALADAWRLVQSWAKIATDTLEQTRR